MTIPLDTVHVSAYVSDAPVYRVPYGEQFWEKTPGTTDRAEADAWAAWLAEYRAGRVLWMDRPWAEQERAMDALRRQWDSDESYVAADGNRYGSKQEHDWIWTREQK